MAASKMTASDSSYFGDFEPVKIFINYFANFKQVKIFNSQFADFEQVIKSVAILETLNKSKKLVVILRF